MAKRKDIEPKSIAAAANPDETSALSAGNEIKIEPQLELPVIDSPPISPGSDTPATETPAPAIESIVVEPAIAPDINAEEAPAAPDARIPFKLNARHKRHALLAASVALAAGIGVAIGAVTTGSQAPAAPSQVAIQHEREMQRSITRLSKEVTTLKANIAAANKAAHSQIAKIADKLPERVEHAASAETTGSVPTPAPRPSVAAAESRLPARPILIKDWAIRDARDGYVYVQGHGDIYQVVPGAPLPGLGPVQSIKREEGRWVVLTPKGIIVSMRDRRYFE